MEVSRSTIDICNLIQFSSVVINGNGQGRRGAMSSSPRQIGSYINQEINNQRWLSWANGCAFEINWFIASVWDSFPSMPINSKRNRLSREKRRNTWRQERCHIFALPFIPVVVKALVSLGSSFQPSPGRWRTHPNDDTALGEWEKQVNLFDNCVTVELLVLLTEVFLLKYFLQNVIIDKWSQYSDVEKKTRVGEKENNDQLYKNKKKEKKRKRQREREHQCHHSIAIVGNDGHLT